MDIIVSIGRNVGQEDVLDDKEWLDYTTRVGSIIREYGWSIGTGFVTHGESTYTDSGRLLAEESATWGWSDFDTRGAVALEGLLRLAADRYGQWGVAVTYGKTKIV